MTKKPTPELITELKKSGWHWSPTNDAWQRKNTRAAEYVANRILKGKFGEPLSNAPIKIDEVVATITPPLKRQTFTGRLGEPSFKKPEPRKPFMQNTKLGKPKIEEPLKFKKQIAKTYFEPLKTVNMQNKASNKPIEPLSSLKDTKTLEGKLKPIKTDTAKPSKQEERILLTDTRPKLSIKEKFEKLYSNFIDSQQKVGTISKDVKVLASNARQTQGTLDYIVTEGLVDKQGKKIGDSLQSIIQRMPLDKEEDFLRYMAHKHNIARAKEGKNVFSQFSAEESAKVAEELLKANPSFEKACKRLYGVDKCFHEGMGRRFSWTRYIKYVETAIS